jgi:hypothetical protein
MFSIFGAILTIFGLFTMDDAMYDISIGKNINLYSGIGMLAFGIFMLIISDLKLGKKIDESLGIDKEELTEEAKKDLLNE